MPLGDEVLRGQCVISHYHLSYKVDQEQGSVIHIVNLATHINEFSNLILHSTEMIQVEISTSFIYSSLL